MDPRYSAQDILLCDLCQKAALQSRCEFCQINLCTACVRIHLSDSFQRHKVVLYKHRKSAFLSYPKCPSHTQELCELYCEICDIPVCSICISSDAHHVHKFTDILKKLSSKTKDLEKDLEELEKRIYPAYEEIALDLKSERVNFEKHYENLKTAVTKQGEDCHSEINIVVNDKKSEIDEMTNKHMTALNKQGKEIKQITSEVKQSILDLKKILDSNDVSVTSVYKSRNAEFRSLPPKVNVSLPSFSPHQINTEQLHQMFGSLSSLSITKEEHGYTIKTPETVSCPSVKSLLPAPELITTIDIDYKLYSVTCLSDEEIWACGQDKIMKLYNIQGQLLKSIQTVSGKIPGDIAVTKNANLVYTDTVSRTVNILKNDQIQEVIRLQGWIPLSVCSTSSGDILITMSGDDKQSKVVRYSGSTEKQTIQFDSEGTPLYSSSYIKYISENRNLDICVADLGANAIVVVNQAGKLRFKYTGHLSSITESFNPRGITTDSRNQILTADGYNEYIHILDQDGQFLCYIDNCDVIKPWGLCVDTRDNLFVAGLHSGRVKKIKYMDGNDVLSKDEIFHLVSDEEVARSQSFSSSEFQYQDPDPNVTTGITKKAEELEKGEVNNSSEFWVKAGKSHAIPVVINKQNTLLCWEFRSHPKDVIFSVTYMEFDRPDPAVTHCLVPACKCDSHKQAVRGELRAKQTGVYTLLFDNTYSRITAKRICYSLWTRHLGD